MSNVRGSRGNPPPTAGPKRRGRPAAGVELMARKLNAAIGAALLNATIPATLAEMCRRAQVPRRTIEKYAADPRIAAELERLRDVRSARRSAEQAARGGAAQATGLGKDEPPQEPPPEPSLLPSSGVRPRSPAPGAAADRPAALDDIQTAAQYAQARLGAIGACQRFVGRHRRVGHVSDLPVTVRDLDIAVRELTAIAQVMRPLATEWVRRVARDTRDAGCPRPPDRPDQRDLFPGGGA